VSGIVFDSIRRQQDTNDQFMVDISNLGTWIPNFR